MAQDWSLLPLDLLGTIALNLDTFEDFIYFSAVCRRWNHAWSSIKHQWKPTPVPWLLLAENTHQNPNHLRKIFNLANNKCYHFNLPETFGTRCWGSPYGWLVMASRDLSVRLFNPITKDEICFPSVEDLPFPPQSYVGTDEEGYCDRCLTYFLTKFVRLQMSRGGVDEFVVVALYSENECLAFARQGDHSWTSLYVNKIFDYVVDVAAVEDRLFAMYETGLIRYWNIYELDTHELGEPMVYSLDGIIILNNSEKIVVICYLLQSSSKLLVVLRYRDELEIPNDDDEAIYEDEVYETRGFKVYQVNPIDKRWYEITDLGEAALIVGNNSSMSVSTLGADCLQRNCIYFTDDENMGWASPKVLGGHDMGVYDIKYDKLWRFYEGVDMHSKLCTPLLFIPRL